MNTLILNIMIPFIKYSFSSFNLQPQMDSVLIKQAIMSAFPHVGNTKEEGKVLSSWYFSLSCLVSEFDIILRQLESSTGYTPENIERVLLRDERAYTKLIESEGFDEPKKEVQSFSKVLATARSAMLQQTI